MHAAYIIHHDNEITNLEPSRRAPFFQPRWVFFGPATEDEPQQRCLSSETPAAGIYTFSVVKDNTLDRGHAQRASSAIPLELLSAGAHSASTSQPIPTFREPVSVLAHLSLGVQ